jgi:D-ribulokinase
MSFFVGIDVGTGSVRAGVFDANGSQLAFATKNIQTWSPKSEFYEQSSEDIWSVRFLVGLLEHRD